MVEWKRWEMKGKMERKIKGDRKGGNALKIENVSKWKKGKWKIL